MVNTVELSTITDEGRDRVKCHPLCLCFRVSAFTSSPLCKMSPTPQRRASHREHRFPSHLNEGAGEDAAAVVVSLGTIENLHRGEERVVQTTRELWCISM